jgi:hypothetical protein
VNISKSQLLSGIFTGFWEKVSFRYEKKPKTPRCVWYNWEELRCLTSKTSHTYRYLSLCRICETSLEYHTYGLATPCVLASDAPQHLAIAVTIGSGMLVCAKWSFTVESGVLTFWTFSHFIETVWCVVRSS